MEIVLSGLVLGLMGSFHCAGMCGPIALSLPLRGNNFYQKIWGGTLYNLGRTLTYGIMGAFFGLIGQGFHMVGFQKWVSITMGVFMILSILLPSLFKKLNFANTDLFSGHIRKGIQHFFKQKSLGGLFFVGLLNGLLPCGLVYMAIAGAIGTTNIYYGIVFMLLFGFGTIPMMLSISILGNLISLGMRNKINRIVPYVVVFVGILFILRGLSLGIPYLSPPQEKLNPKVHLTMDESEEPADAIKGSCCHPKN